MYRPQRYLVRMVVFLVFVGLAVAVLSPRLKDAFLANALLNGMILGVLLLGIVYLFRQVVSLNPEIAWLARLRAETSERLIFPESLSTERPPRLLGSACRSANGYLIATRMDVEPKLLLDAGEIFVKLSVKRAGQPVVFESQYNMGCFGVGRLARPGSRCGVQSFLQSFDPPAIRPFPQTGC